MNAPSARIPRSLESWLRLARAPNLLTAPGDPLAGALLAGGFGWRAACAMGAATLIYAGGAMLNDVMDLETDRQLRPERPLPSGELPPAAARAAAGGALVLGALVALSAGWAVGAIATALCFTVVAYDTVLKRGSAGAWAMGACRGQSLLMGAAAATGTAETQRPLAALAAAALIALYTAAVTTLSRSEDDRRRIEQRRWGPALAALAVAIAVLFALGADPRARLLGALLAGVAAIRAVGPAERWNLAPPDRRRALIGRLVGALPLLQASFMAASAGAAEPLALVWALLAALHPLTARRFAAG